LRFEDLHLIEPLVRAVHHEGYERPTPIQEQAIPHVLAGRDLLGCAQTGTGKTAAFALPILQRLVAAHPDLAHQRERPIRVLVLSPTRELAAQIGDSFAVYGRHLGLHHTVVFGGVGQDAQTKALRRGVDILVATPGRLLDLMQQGFVRYDRLEVFVLDEADRMLDMGFIHDVRKVIAKLPLKRQTLLFSATMPADIQELSQKILVKPVRVEVTPVATTAEKIDQSVYFVDKSNKRALLIDLLRDPQITRALVFSRTKHGANRVVEQLERAGIASVAIHGNKSQNARERALSGFKGGTTRVLVATDIAARGIDVEDISHVINYDLPEVPETYVHRIGRTARAGASGKAISFCDSEERIMLADIERLIRLKVPVVTEHPYPPGSGTSGGSLPPRHPQARPQRHEHAHPRPQPAQKQRGHERRPHGHERSHPQPHGHAPAPPRHTTQPGASRPAATPSGASSGNRPVVHDFRSVLRGTRPPGGPNRGGRGRR
jgi:ATP-dependent RNA helicase RhlE